MHTVASLDSAGEMQGEFSITERPQDVPRDVRIAAAMALSGLAEEFEFDDEEDDDDTEGMVELKLTQPTPEGVGGS